MWLYQIENYKYMYKTRKYIIVKRMMLLYFKFFFGLKILKPV